MRSTIGRFLHASGPILAALVAFSAALGASSCGGSGDQAAKAPEALVQAERAEPAPQAAEPAVQAAPGAPAAPAAPAGAAPQAGQAAATSAPAADPAPGAAPAPAPAQGQAPAVQRRLGEIVFAEGVVSVHRAGSTPERADIGQAVRAFDVLVTGPKSRAEIDIASGFPGGATVKLAENTAFYFDTKELDEARKTTLQLLSGSLAVKVDRLANGSFRVATDGAVLGVRGTVFIVDTVPDGSLLVSCESGAVAVGADGSTAVAKPGAAVELSEAGGPATVPVDASALGAYRGEWRTDAYAAFAPKALTYTSLYAAAVEAGAPAFDAALAGLRAQEPALAAWRAARAAGREPRFTDWIAEKKAVSAALLVCLKALFALERPYYRLVELKALHEAGTGVGALEDGRSSAAYFASFDKTAAGLAVGMGRVREALSLFSWVSAGSPLGDFFGSKAESLGTGAVFFED